MYLFSSDAEVYFSAGIDRLISLPAGSNPRVPRCSRVALALTLQGFVLFLNRLIDRLHIADIISPQLAQTVPV